MLFRSASPRRLHPKTGKLAKSVLKPIFGNYTNLSFDSEKNKLETVTLPVASQDEIDQTVSVMGGEDWEFWIDILEKNNLLDQGIKTVAYSYIGPEVTKAIYRNGTIGRAKDHLEATSKKLDERLRKIGGRAFISVNKALVTQSSSAIPFIPLYFILLSRVMREKGIDESCIEQVYRLFAGYLYSGKDVMTDANGFIRLDDREMRADVQKLVNERWAKLNDTTLPEFADLAGHEKDFLGLFGFGQAGVNYSEDIDPQFNLPSALS